MTSSLVNQEQLCCVLTKIDTVNPEAFQAFSTSLLAIRPSAVDLKGLATTDKPKLRGKKDLVTLAGALEPSPNQFLAVTVQAVECKWLIVSLPRWVAENLLSTIPMSASHLVGTIKEFETFLVTGIRPISVVGHAHHAKTKGWHLGAILAELTESDRFVGHDELNLEVKSKRRWWNSWKLGIWLLKSRGKTGFK